MTDASLPQLDHRLFVTDSGLETTLIFHDGMALPEFAAFPLVDTPAGRDRLRDYFQIRLDIARGVGAGFVAEAPTWRANHDWGRRLGYDDRQLAVVNRAAISLPADLRERAGQPPTSPPRSTRARRGWSVSAVSGPTPRGSATPSSTPPPSSTPAIPTSSDASTRSWSPP